MISLGRGRFNTPHNKISTCGSGAGSRSPDRVFSGLGQTNFRECVEGCTGAWINVSTDKYNQCIAGCRSRFGQQYAPVADEAPTAYGPAAPTAEQWAEMKRIEAEAAARASAQQHRQPGQPGQPGAPGKPADWKTWGLPVAAGAAGLLAIVAFLGQTSKASSG